MSEALVPGAPERIVDAARHFALPLTRTAILPAWHFFGLAAGAATVAAG